jgi:membrane-associated protein
MNLLDPHSLLSQLGPWAVLLVMFAETGLLIGFFLPGDSLLFTAGLLTTTATHLSLPATLVLAPLGAVAGAQVGYLLGRRLGPALVERPSYWPGSSRAYGP